MSLQYPSTISCTPQELLHALVTSPPAECPYGLSAEAVYQYGFFPRLPEDFLSFFLETGFRRNGNCLYNMTCPDCSGCVPIRLRPADFSPSRSQRRCWRRNRDLLVRVGPLEISEEKIALCQRFLDHRYPGHNNTAEDYYTGFFLNSLCTTVEFNYFLGDRLLGVGIVDLSAAWLNAVYFYFEPGEKKRSLGTFNILTMIDFCRTRAIKTLYLGYWIAECRAMAYKGNFRPHQLFRNNQWQVVKAKGDPDQQSGKKVS